MPLHNSPFISLSWHLAGPLPALPQRNKHLVLLYPLAPHNALCPSRNTAYISPNQLSFSQWFSPSKSLYTQPLNMLFKHCFAEQTSTNTLSNHRHKQQALHWSFTTLRQLGPDCPISWGFFGLLLGLRPSHRQLGFPYITQISSSKTRLASFKATILFCSAIWGLMATLGLQPSSLDRIEHR